MAGQIAGISLSNMVHSEWGYPFFISNATLSNVGCAMSLDATAARTMQPATDGAVIEGKLFSYEDRKQEGIKVGTVRLKGGFVFKKKAGAVINVGQSVVGAGNGEVKAAAARIANNVVTAVDGNDIEVLFT